MRTLGIVLASVLVLTACGEPSNVAATSTTVATATTAPPSSTTTTMGTSSDGLDVIVPPDDSGAYPSELVVACPGGPAFPISALDEIPLLSESDPGGVAEAIAPFLEGEEGAFWPQEDWRILHQSEDEVLLVHSGVDLSFMTVELEDGEWRWSGSQMGGPCPLQFTVPEGLNSVEWRLDPDAELTASSVEIPVLLTERECVGGQEIGDRLVGPQIVMTETTVFVAFAALPPPGDAFDCPGNPDMAYVVELPEPLGERELMEGLNLGIGLEDYLD